MEGRGDDDNESRGVQVDLYGVKFRVVPQGGPPSDPKTWRDVAVRINAELMAIVTNVVSLAADIVRSARSLVRSVGGLDRQAAERVDQAHAAADFNEMYRGEGPLQSFADKEAAVKFIADLVRRKRISGLAADVFVDPESGKAVVSILPPCSPEDAQAIAAEVMAQMLTNASESAAHDEESA